MSVHYDDGTVTVYAGDCIEVMCGLPDASVDAVVTDPPYGLEFMRKEWDAPWKASGAVVHDPATERGGFQDGNGGNPYSRSRIEYGRGGAESGAFQQWCQQWATEALRVLKPGGHLAAFGGTRTWHRLACAIEDAGFEIRDCLAWMYGSGFPKSLDVSKAIDKAAGAEREVVGQREVWGRGVERFTDIGQDIPVDGNSSVPVTAPATDAARQWQGWGTALKPAYEPIVLARKPLAGTVAANVQAHGTGALNIDGCRVGTEDDTTRKPALVGQTSTPSGAGMAMGGTGSPLGRWPANVVLDDTAAAMLDEQSGVTPAGNYPANRSGIGYMGGASDTEGDKATTGDTGGASRFFYTAKAGRDERPTADGVAHPTVKPLDLMRWLVRLVTPPGGVVLEPFAGSGTTAEACIVEGFRCIAIERETDYLPLIVARLSKPIQPTLEAL